ncbi:hypothetical protein [Streptomyces acidicola]|uniref:hypothetical protein n=1 Tax=Streptomyces acidicola TaxID=2596892 RepID=UPI003817D1F9
MRGLSNRPGPDGTGQALKAVITAVAVITALGLFVAACGTGGTGARDEGPAGNDSRAKGTASPSASPTESRETTAQVVELVRADPRVGKAVKRDLHPCVADEYPVDVSYGKLTGGSANDIVVNVMTCGDAVGVASYVYRAKRSGYENVFRAEEPPVYAEIDRGGLVVTQQLYGKGDPVEFPSSEEVITYRWSMNGFAEESRTHNDYSSAVGDSDTSEPVPVPTPAPAETLKPTESS